MTSTFTHFVFREPDGTERSLFPANGTSAGGDYTCESLPSARPIRGKLFVAHDDSGIRFESSRVEDFQDDWDPNLYLTGAHFNPRDANGVLYYPDGTRYMIVDGTVRSIVDRNGNKTTLNYIPETFVLQTVTDSSGRVTTFDYNVTPCPATECHTVNFKDEGGTYRTIRLQFKPLGQVFRSDVPSVPTVFQEVGGGFTVTYPLMLAQVDLPNGSSWKLFYNEYGEFAKVVLPSGGAIEYDHGQGFASLFNEGIFASGMVLNQLHRTYESLSTETLTPTAPWRPFVYRRLLERRSYDTAYSTNEGSTKRPLGTFALRTEYPKFETALVPRYTDALLSDFTISTTDVQEKMYDGDGTATGTLKAHIYRLFQGGEYHSEGKASPGKDLKIGSEDANARSVLRTHPRPMEGKELQTATGVNGELLSLQHRVYGFEESGRTAKLCQERTTFTTGANVVQSGRIYFWDMQELANGDRLKYGSDYLYGNLTHVFEYDYGYAPAILGEATPSPICPTSAPANYLRKTVTKYKQAKADYLVGGAAGGTWITSLPEAVQIYDPDQSELVAETKYFYDQQTPDTKSGVVQAEYCAALKSQRGNLTKVSRTVKDLFTGVVPTVGTRVENEEYTYDCIGNAITRVDFGGTKTTLTYSDSFSSSSGLTGQSLAYLTKVELLDGQAKFTASQRQYNFHTGKPTNEVDANGLVTTFSHGDVLRRWTSTFRGLGLSEQIPSQSRAVYSDTVTAGDKPTSVRIDSDQYFGGSPSPSKTTHYDGLGRAILTEHHGAETILESVKYDGLGRIVKRCNPARANPPAQCTTIGYDAIGRLTSETKPDGAMVSYSYAAAPTGFSLVVTSIDEAGVKKSLQMDAAGRVKRVIEDPVCCFNSKLRAFRR
ncbi:MAG: hypothetical protein U0R19_02415 [Bryobacteraceae bacterium]